MNKILVIGDNCIDLKISYNFSFKKDKNFIPKDYSLTPGGTGVNFAVAFSKLEGASYYFTPISDDPFGKIFRNYFEESRVHFAGDISNKKTALIVSFLNRIGERTTFALINNASYTDISYDKFVEIFKKFEYVYISGGILTDIKAQGEIKKIAKYTKEVDKKLFFDPQLRIGKDIEGFNQSISEISKLSDIIFSNENEIEALGKSELDSMIRSGTIILVKKGENGASAYSREGIYEANPLKVNSKDTIGAGDIFNAAFVKMYLQSASIKESLDFANKIAALSTTRIGFFVPSNL